MSIGSTFITVPLADEVRGNALGWISDCSWGDLEEGERPDLTDLEIVRGIQRHYDGGWDGFILDGSY